MKRRIVLLAGSVLLEVASYVLVLVLSKNSSVLLKVIFECLVMSRMIKNFLVVRIFRCFRFGAVMSKVSGVKIISLVVVVAMLGGCFGVSVSVPEKESQYMAERYTESDATSNVWCGVTLVVVVVPIPLKLPVCSLKPGQKLTTPFYACGPFMFLGPLVHSYSGNALCGKFSA
ncbi:hypothetical protein [Pseudomonas alkylphenolica]|uniref:Uncharacterized protein n=1 Tax=Pseudomonas alkylphenolica TaxID=237609 RepID=A0A077FDH6_9PSED|nr:hypothetical protein [Pseudomonas alkylphenolica]AIL61331.1 hypothetical protein PSAKL28_21100 [Pseudomonas alkylphenolica]